MAELSTPFVSLGRVLIQACMNEMAGVWEGVDSAFPSEMVGVEKSLMPGRVGWEILQQPYRSAGHLSQWG